MDLLFYYVFSLIITILWIKTPDHVYDGVFRKSKLDGFLLARAILGCRAIRWILLIHIIAKTILGEPLTNKQIK